MYWSWILGIVGLTGFILAGRKVWWCWYINVGCQVLWFIYAIVTEQYGFIATALVYTFVFGQNAWKWTKEHRQKPGAGWVFYDNSVIHEPCDGEFYTGHLDPEEVAAMIRAHVSGICKDGK